MRPAATSAGRFCGFGVSDLMEVTDVDSALGPAVATSSFLALVAPATVERHSVTSDSVAEGVPFELTASVLVPTVAATGTSVLVPTATVEICSVTFDSVAEGVPLELTASVLVPTVTATGT